MINQEAQANPQPAGPQGTPGDGQGRRAQILEAALHVMAEHGFRGASIKRIAEQAGLKSPALIYWYFKDKQALLEAMLDSMAPFLAIVADQEALLDEPPQQVLPRIVAGFLRTVQQPAIGRFVRLLLSESARHPSLGKFFAERGPMLILTFLERYLARQVELGRLRPHDPRGGARAFMGMLVVYAIGREVFPVIGAGFPPADEYASEVTRIFLGGLAVSP
jgi:TetR/AcrR family transcriptional regulator